MATTLADIRFIVERDVETTLDDKTIINWCNMAQNDFMLRVFIPDDTTIAINTTDLIYTVPADMRKIRRIRRQSDIDRGYNQPYNPVYTLYNGEFQVPVPFGSDDTLLIDYYRYMTFFDDIGDTIDVDDRYFPLYSSYIEMRYYRLPSTVTRLGQNETNMRYQESSLVYATTKKQVTDAYTIDIGIQKPAESGW